MKDEEFDQLLKKQMQADKYMPERINRLFLNFESEVNMKKSKKRSKSLKFSNYLKIIPIASCIILTVFVGGCTYAHVNGAETLFSPLLRKLGINSKYEENATQFNSKVTKQEVTIKLLDGAIDDTSLIIGYEIEIKDNNPDAWLEIDGEYMINDINVKPINTTIDKLSDTSYIYYQIFDINEIKIDNTENVKINANIYEIKEYTESETLDSVYLVYGESFTNKWNFEETIAVKKLETSKIYKFTNQKEYEVIEGVDVSVTEFITGSYTNILKIKTDKTNYHGDDFEKYYKILDKQNQEIAMFSEEERQYDSRVYNDRLVVGNINKNSEIIIEIYLKLIQESNFKKVATIPVDLSKATEKINIQSNLKQYNAKDYNFTYKGDWNVISKLDVNDVGPNSIYLGALALEIPSTTNSEYGSSIYVKTTDKNTTIKEYAEQVRKENTESPSEYFQEKTSSEINFKNQEGYQITAETTDGEEMYIKQDIFTVVNAKVYRVTFFGSEKEYINLKDDINEFISNFEI